MTAHLGKFIADHFHLLGNQALCHHVVLAYYTVTDAHDVARVRVHFVFRHMQLSMKP